MYMDEDQRKALGVRLWQCFDVLKIEIETTRHKYQRETKWVYAKHAGTPYGWTRFLWYEVEIINNRSMKVTPINDDTGSDFSLVKIITAANILTARFTAQ
jgi:hypothetical protein